LAGDLASHDSAHEDDHEEEEQQHEKGEVVYLKLSTTNDSAEQGRKKVSLFICSVLF